MPPILIEVSMERSILLGKAGDTEVRLLAAMANRHGLIAGSTGTGKTVSLKLVAEGLSAMGIPVFLADIKGDLAGLAMPGEMTKAVQDRAAGLKISAPSPSGFPVMFWDLFGALGHPLRATVSEMGPLLLGQILGLNDTQFAVLTLAFRYADDRGLLLLDLKDLRALLQHVDETRDEFCSAYGNVSTASLGAIQRGLILLEEQGGEAFFGEPALDFSDFLQTDEKGRGYINILAAEKLYQSSKIYSMALLWLLAELFEQLPEVGDIDKPKLVFFFDEAHLLFDEASKPLLEKIEHVVRLIRSKGVGVFFATQNPLDIPDNVLGQLGNRVQHAMRAFTARDKKGVSAIAETFRAKGDENLSEALTQLAIGEALVSCLDATGIPVPVERAFICPPASRIGPLSADERVQVMSRSLVAGHYENSVDRDSAYEMLRNRAGSEAPPAAPPPRPGGQPAAPAPAATQPSGGGFSLPPLFGGGAPAKGHQRQTPGEAFVMSTVRSIGSQVGRQLIRGVLGSILGKSR